MLPDPIQSSPDVDLFPFGPEATPGPLPAGLEVSSVEPAGTPVDGPASRPEAPERSRLDPGDTRPPGYAAEGPAPASTGDATLALRKERYRLQQAVQQDADRAAELQDALDALAALKGVGDNVWLDQRLTPEELRRVAGWGEDAAAARDGARFLLAHPEYLAGAANEGGDLTRWRIDGALTALRERKAGADRTLATDQAALASVQLELGEEPPAPASTRPAASGPKGPTGAAGAPGTGSAASAAPGSTEALLARPLSLDMGTVRGGDPLTSATDRLTNAMGGLEAQIDQVVAQLGQETDPGKRSALEARLNQLNRAMTEVTNMLQQLTTMMQNIAKLFNDIAMNAIRHIA